MSNSQADSSNEFGALKESRFDTVELTLLLKIIGFRLDSIDFLKNFKYDNGIEVEIKCKKTGLISKMTYENGICTCPTEKTSNDNSFWEIQSTAPNHSVNLKETSSNLLPVITTEKMTKLKSYIKALMTTIMEDVFKENGVVSNSLSMVDQNSNNILDPKILDNNKNGPIISPINQMQLLPDEEYLTPLSSINVTPTTSDHIIRSNVGVPKIILSSTSEYQTPDSKIDKNEEIGEVFVSPCSDIFTDNSNDNDLQQKNTNPNKKLNIIMSIRDAHEKIVHALSLLESNDTTINTSTPNARGAKLSLTRSSTKILISKPLPGLESRRHSLSAIPLNAAKTIAGRKSLSSIPASPLPVNGRPSLPPRNSKIVPIRPVAKVASRLSENSLASSKLPQKSSVLHTATPRPQSTISTRLLHDYKMSTLTNGSIINRAKFNSALTKSTSKSMPKLPTIN